MSNTRAERLDNLYDTEEAWSEVSNATNRVLRLPTVECNTMIREGLRHWSNGFPTVNLPELGISGIKIKVFYQFPEDGDFVNFGITLSDGAIAHDIEYYLRADYRQLIVDGESMGHDVNSLIFISDLLKRYQIELQRSYDNNYIEAVTLTAPIQQVA